MFSEFGNAFYVFAGALARPMSPAGIPQGSRESSAMAWAPCEALSMPRGGFLLRPRGALVGLHYGPAEGPTRPQLPHRSGESFTKAHGPRRAPLEPKGRHQGPGPDAQPHGSTYQPPAPFRHTTLNKHFDKMEWIRASSTPHTWQ